MKVYYSTQVGQLEERVDVEGDIDDCIRVLSLVTEKDDFESRLREGSLDRVLRTQYGLHRKPTMR